MTMCGSTWKTPPRAAICNHVNWLTAITGGSRPDAPRSATTVALLQERHGWPGRAIEDCLHRVLDVTMNRDQQRNRKGSGLENLAMMQRFALDLARLEPTKDSMRGKLKCASRNDDFLLKIIRAAKPKPQKR